jgi:hypothetical protein
MFVNGDPDVFRNVPGLLQKYYIAEESTGAISGIYIFKTKRARESLLDFRTGKEYPCQVWRNP